MFAYINGFLEDVTVDNAVIDVNGFGINVYGGNPGGVRPEFGGCQRKNAGAGTHVENVSMSGAEAI